MKVIGTTLYTKGMDNAIEEFMALAVQKADNLLVSPSDANVLVHARRNPDFKTILDSFYWNLPDGVPSVWILRLKGAKQANRCSGPDFFKRVIEESKNLPISHYLCGGAEGVAKELAEKCKTWGNKNIVGFYSPPFKELSEQEIKQIAEQINRTKANVVWVGLGAPKQIYFAKQIAAFTNVQFIVPVGAAFDFHTNRIKKAPNWIQKIGMEWFYRLCKEPKRLAGRYFKVVPLFIWYNFIGVFKRKK